MAKIRVDLAVRWGQSLLVLITLGGAASLLYLGLVTLDGSTSPYDQQMLRTNGAHAWFWTTGGPDGEQLVQALARMPGVLEATEPRPAVSVRLILPQQDDVPKLLMMGLSPGEAKVGRHLITRGRGLKSGDSAEAGVLSSAFARFFEIQVGDQIQIATPNGAQRITIIGLEADPMNCQFPYCGPAPLYLLPAAFDRLSPGMNPGFLVGVRLFHPEEAEAFRVQVQKDIRSKAQITSAWTWLSIRNEYRLAQGFTLLFILAFGMTAVAAAAMITANVVSGAVLSQFREIGILKSFGFSRFHLLLVQGGQHLLSGLAGGGFGIAIGHLLVRRTLGPLADSMGTPNVLRFQPWAAVIVLIITALVVILSAVAAAWRPTGLHPANVLRDGFSLPQPRTPVLVGLLTLLRSPAVISLGIKDVTARPARAAMTVISLMLCLVTIAMSIALTAVADRYQSDPTMHGIMHDLEIDRGYLSDTELDQLLANHAGILAAYQEIPISILAAEQQIGFTIRALSGDWEGFDFSLLEGRMHKEPDELVLGSGLMERLGLHVGDQVVLQLREFEVPFRVVGRIRDMQNLGRTGLIQREALHQVGLDVEPLQWRVRLRPGFEREEVRRDLLKEIGYSVTVNLPGPTLPPMVIDLIDLVRTLSIMMIGMAVLGVLNTALLTAREQAREVGIRKALGMTPLQILCAVGVGGAWLGLLGAMLGIPTGLWLTRFLVGSLADSMGLGPIGFGFSPSHIGSMIVGGIVIATGAALPAALWAARVPVAAVLHAE